MSRLLENGGWAVIRNLIDPEWLEELTVEAKSSTLTFTGAGSIVERSVTRIEGGTVLDSLYRSPALIQVVSDLVARPVRCSGDLGAYSEYRGSDAFMATHRDISKCELTLIVCLEDNHWRSEGGALEVWQDTEMTPIESLVDVHRSSFRVAAAPGDCILLHGTVLPHGVPPLDVADRYRLITALCFNFG